MASSIIPEEEAPYSELGCVDWGLRLLFFFVFESSRSVALALDSGPKLYASFEDKVSII